MAVDFSEFSQKTAAVSTDYLVGYDQNASGGEKKFTLSTIANAVSGIIAPSFAQTPAFTGTFKNKLINGNFDIWQRGSVTTASNNNSHVGFYGADRWGFSPNLVGTVSTNLSSFDVTQTQVPNNPTNYLSFNTTVASTGTPFLYQRIENVRILSGKTVTLSFYAKSNISLSVTIGYSYWYGLPIAAGGTFSNQTNTSAGTITTTSNWTKYTITTTLPSIASGLSVDASQNTFLQLYFGLPAGTTYAFDIAQVQLEEGSVATPFEQRPIGTELALCERYYQGKRRFGSTGRSIPNSGVLNNSVALISPTMRSIPSVTIYDPIAYNAGSYIYGAMILTGVTSEWVAFAAEINYQAWYFAASYNLNAEL
jgi:hypothetical protein